jgi:DNA-binding MarR family transcriptional regulator
LFVASNILLVEKFECPNEARGGLIAQLSDAVREMQRATDAVDQAAADRLGINRTDARCLDILHGPEPMTAGQLAEQAGLSPGAVTTVLDRLERRGFVRRLPDASDRRRVLVELTPEIVALSTELYGPMAEAAKELERYSDHDLRVLRDFARNSRDFQNEQAARIRALAPLPPAEG